MTRLATIPSGFVAGAALLALVAVARHGAAQQEHTVTRVGIVANPRIFNGACPAQIRFTATIMVSRHPVAVSYQWERSDGASGRREQVQIRSAGQGVSTTWRLGAAGQHLTVWEKLHVLAPTGITSDSAPVRINCR